MHGEYKVKVTGGKLVSIKAEYDKRIEKVSIFGDFFLHPEGTIYKIEDSLAGMAAHSGKEAFKQRISKVLEEEHATLIGADAESIASAIEEAIKNGVEGNQT